MAYIDTGLGWYLDEDYLLTLGSQQLGTVTSGGGQETFFDIPNIPADQPVNTSTIVSYGSIPVYATGPSGTVPIWTAVLMRDFNGNVASAHAYAAWITGTSKLLVFCPRGDSSEPTSVAMFYLCWSDNNNFWTSQDSSIYVDNKLYLFNTSIGSGAAPVPGIPNYATIVDAIRAFASSSVTRTVTKVQGGAGAFAMVSYPKDGDNVYVGVGISSIPNPNSAATVAVDGTNGSYDTFNRETINFTMFYTPELSGTLTSNVPVVAVSDELDPSSPLYTVRLFLAVANAAQIHAGLAPEEDPYSGAGESEPGAEEATFDFDSTAVDFGTPPTVTAAGMVELYIPSTSDLASLAQYLWAGSFDPDNFKKLFADPMDAIIGLQIVPVTATEIGTTPDTLYVGNISTGLSMPKASRQYVPVDCGSLSIPRRLGSYLDYSPHTEMQLYLPYIGFVDISPDDCMGGTVSVKYMVDIIGGTCVAQVKCNDHVLYEYAAACSCQVPVSAGQYQNIVLGAVRGGIGLVSGILGAAGGGLFSGLSEAADAAMSMTKPKIQRSGGFGGSSGLMGHQTPYIIYTVPRLIVPGRQNNFIGYPSYITRTLGDLTGYTQIDSIHLSGIPASQSEQAEIEQLLREGVYL